MRLFRNSDVLLLGVVGAAAYFAWKQKEKFEEGIDEWLAKPIADAWIGVTMPGHVKLTGTAVFPSGYRVSMSQLNIEPDTLSFNHLGHRYRIDRRDGDNYIVVPV